MDHGSSSKSTLPLPSNYIHHLDHDNSRNIDVSTIKGNISDDMKRLGQAAWDFFVSTEDKSFGANIGKRLKFAEMNILGEKGLSYAQTVGFITIDKGTWYSNEFSRAELFIIKLRFMQYFWNAPWSLCSVYCGSVCICSIFFFHMLFAHPCACSCSVSSLVLLGAFLGIDGGGVSQSMNLIWHHTIEMQVHLLLVLKRSFRGARLKVVSTSLSI